MHVYQNLNVHRSPQLYAFYLFTHPGIPISSCTDVLSAVSTQLMVISSSSVSAMTYPYNR